MKNLWSDEEIQTIKDMWADGKTAAQISKKLNNKSRSSVLAKARRLNLPSRAKGKPSCEKKQAKKQSDKIIVRTPPKRKKYKPTIEREKISLSAYGDKCSMSELKNSQCCWPVGDPKDDDFGFCAAKKQSPSSNYCEQHASIAYAKK